MKAQCLASKPFIKAAFHLMATERSGLALDVNDVKGNKNSTSVDTMFYQH